MHEAEKIIAALGLQPLAGEGGFYRRTWTGPTPPGGERPVGTAIYYLITREGFSALHRLAQDEVWHFYAGDPVRLVMLQSGAVEVVSLGPDFLAGQQPQCTVPAGVWQGARLADEAGQGWALLGCTLAPGWSERDFTLGERATLLREFPAAGDEIARLVR